MHQKTRAGNQEAGWLLFFYTVPARPVGNRMRIWRKLARIGAIQLNKHPRKNTRPQQSRIIGHTRPHLKVTRR